MFKKFLKHEEGQGLVEYALILVLVAIVVIAILLQLGPQIGEVFSRVTLGLSRAGIITSSGAVTGVTASSIWDPLSGTATVTINIMVNTATSVTISGGLTGSASCPAPPAACQVTVTSSSQNGTFTVADPGGGAVLQGYW